MITLYPTLVSEEKMDRSITSSPQSVLDFPSYLRPRATDNDVVRHFNNPTATTLENGNADGSGNDRFPIIRRTKCFSLSSSSLSSFSSSTEPPSSTLCCGEKRKLEFGDVDLSSPTPKMQKSMNFRHRLVCDKTVEWLAAAGGCDGDDDDNTVEQLQQLWLGPVFESSSTLLTAIATLPDTVTHLDIDLRNSLHLTPQAMPVLMSKTNVDTLSVRFFGDAGAIELAKWLHMNRQLKHLDLHGNRIGDHGIEAVLDALLACNHPLETLNLSWNCIVNGGNTIRDYVQSNCCNLKRLDLSYNWIGDDELERLCEGLSSRSSSCVNLPLQDLNIFGCQRITSKGLKVLLDCLKYHNTTLQTVHVQTLVENSKEVSEVRAKIEYWLSLNRAGRNLLKQETSEGANATKVPTGLWPLVFERNNLNSDVIFHLLQEGCPKGVL